MPLGGLKTRGPWILLLCLTPATGVTNSNFLQTDFIVTSPSSFTRYKASKSD